METVILVTVSTGSEEYRTPEGGLGFRVLYGPSRVCQQCVAECGGLNCKFLKQTHTMDERDGSCDHCTTCDEDKGTVESESCHVEREHVCDAAGQECSSCMACLDCYESCCESVDEEAHFAAQYEVVRSATGQHVCPAGHYIDQDEVERQQAVEQMRSAGVPLLL